MYNRSAHIMEDLRSALTRPAASPGTAEGNHMKERGTRLALQTVFFLVLFGAAAPLRAHELNVCNKGTVPVMVVTAMKNTDLARGLGKYYWAIRSTAVASGKCKSVYSDMYGYGAYLDLVLRMRK